MAAAATDIETGTARIERLFDVHHGRLYRLARRLSATPDEARDLVQETFLRVVRSPRSVPPDPTAEEAWLVRILVNACRDTWRKAKSRRRLDAHYRTGRWTLGPPSPENAAIVRDTLWLALQTLPPRRRAAIILHELEGQNTAQIALLLGVSIVTVRWHLSRGRVELAKAIALGTGGER